MASKADANENFATEITASATLAVGQANKIIEVNSASAVVLTVPSGVFSAGNSVSIIRKGAGAVTFAGGVKQSMTLPITAGNTGAGTVRVTVTAPGGGANLAAGLLITTASITASSTAIVVASALRTALNANSDITNYYDVGSTVDANVVLTRKVGAANEASTMVFSLGTATAATAGTVVAVAGVAGAILTSSGNKLAVSTQNEIATLIFKTANTAYLFGSLA
jgi:hypothetical protein